jgi:hypothetical protein
MADAPVASSRRDIEHRISELDKTIAYVDRYLEKLRRERINLKLLLTDKEQAGRGDG